MTTWLREKSKDGVVELSSARERRYHIKPEEPLNATGAQHFFYNPVKKLAP
jgi:hypothetical protein